MDLESRLRAALRPEDPGAEFTAAVMSRVSAPRPAAKPARRWRVPAALAATLFAAAFGLHWHVMQQREAAGRQLALALEITSHELNEVQKKLVRNGSQENGT
jgi:hypothetical protein